MTKFSTRMGATLLALTTCALVVTVPAVSWAQVTSVDPAAVKILKRTMDYLDSLQQFSVDTQNTVEDVLESGQKVQFDISAKVVVKRPNKLRVQRGGDIISQSWYYDGKLLTLYNPSDKYYATASAPGTIEKALDFARESLGIYAPASDLIYKDAFPLLMQNVTAAIVVGKAVIGGVTCDHVVFSRPDVDFQVWVADTGKPLPLKYVVVDTGVPEQVETISVMSNWNLAPKTTDAMFTFVPPQGAKKTEFVPVASWVAQ
jgi:hypothetical protein